jgi:hypothetical protein
MPNLVMAAEGVKALAKMPSREELLSKLMGTMQAPIAKFVRPSTKFRRGSCARSPPCAIRSSEKRAPKPAWLPPATGRIHSGLDRPVRQHSIQSTSNSEHLKWHFRKAEILDAIAGMTVLETVRTDQG